MCKHTLASLIDYIDGDEYSVAEPIPFPRDTALPAYVDNNERIEDSLDF